MMFDFLRDYVNMLPEEVREDPEFGFELQKGASSQLLQVVQLNFPLKIPKDLEIFYEFSNGAQLGEYSVFQINELEDRYRELGEVFGFEQVQGLIPFALLMGVGDYVIIDTRKPGRAEAPILDGFHEHMPTQWEKIAPGLRQWLEQMCKSDFEAYWLGR